MALATGILVGSSLLNQSLIDSQRSTIATFADEKNSLRRDLGIAQGQIAYRDDYFASLYSRLLTGQLAGHHVAFVMLPGSAPTEADALVKTLTAAGAVVSSRVDISVDFFATATDPDGGKKAAQRDQTIRKFALAEVASRTPEAQLAGALLSRTSGPGLEIAAGNLITELDREALITREELSERGDLAVLIAGAATTKPEPSDSREAAGAVKLAAAFAAAGNGTIVVGPAEAATGGPLQAVRKDSAVSKFVSTVDGVETPFGQVAAAYALVEQVAGGAGRYGGSDSGDAPLPKFRAPPVAK
jgi:hypothetical protein